MVIGKPNAAVDSKFLLGSVVVAHYICYWGSSPGVTPHRSHGWSSMNETQKKKFLF